MFNNAKKLINPKRNGLYKRMIKASEYLKNWWNRGLIVQQRHIPKNDDSDIYDLGEDDCGL
jgi:hypothetical protein